MSARSILLVHPLSGGHRPPKFSDEQLTIGPSDDLHLWDGNARPLRTPFGHFDLKKHVLDRIPESAAAGTLVVWTQGQLCLPQGTRCFSGRRVLYVGDTHHFDRPLEAAILYATAEDFDAVLVGVRHHAHWFRAAGLKNVYWLPPGASRRKAQSVIAEKRREILVIGQLGDHHPRRRRLVQTLIDQGYPVRIHQCSMDDAMGEYARALINLNVSLNGDPNGRFFDVPAAGGCLLTDRLSPLAGVDQYYKEGDHYLAFGDPSELLQKVDEILARPDIATSIGAQALSRYNTFFDPDIVRAQFWNIVDEGQVHPSYDLQLEPRFAAARPSRPTDIWNDLAIYQIVQECQRVREAPDILLLPGLSPSVADHCADLPRVRLHCLADDHANWQASSAMAMSSPVRSVSQAAANQRQWDLVVGPASGDQMATGYPAARWIAVGPNAENAWLAVDAKVENVRLLAEGMVDMAAKAEAASDAPLLANFMSEYFDASSGRIHLWRRPRQSGPLIFAIHGFLHNGQEALPALSPVMPHAELVAVDLPGHGLSLACSDMSLPTLSAMVVEYLQSAASRRPVILLGDGLGALVAAAAARTLNPTAVLLLDPPLSTAKQWWMFDEYRKSLLRHDLINMAPMAEDILGIGTDQVVEKDYLSNLLTPPPKNCVILTRGEPLWPRRMITAVPSSLDEEDVARITRDIGPALQILYIEGAGYPLLSCAPSAIAELLEQLIAQL